MSGTTRRFMVLLSTLALLAGLMVPGAVAQPADCVPIMPVSQLKSLLRAGPVTGEGLTVVQGTTPERFTVRFLGVLDNGISLGRDMIIVEVGGTAVDNAGGIWDGMSGSPVYIGDQLVGAVAYGLSFVSTAVGGLTPAEDMIDLVSLPDGQPQTFASADGTGQDEAAAETIVVSGSLAGEITRRVEGAGGPSFAEAGGTWRNADSSVNFRRLALPYSVSGLNADRLDTLQDAMRSAGFEINAYAGGRADFSQVNSTAEAPVAGGNLAVADSLGDLTAAAVGTATIVCDGKTVGFGHPFSFSGQTLSAATTADAITIIPDPGSAPYKLANIGGVFGTIDQDRLAGVRGRNGDIPDSTPVRSFVDDIDTGNSRRGRTDVIRPLVVPDLAAFHLLANIDTVIDRVGRGSSSVSFTARGTGSESGAFTLTRDNVFASPFDVAFESIFEMLGMLATMQGFTGEEVSIDSVQMRASVQQAVLAYLMQEVRIGVDGAEPTVPQAELIVEPGSVLTIEIDLAGLDDDAATTVTLEVPVSEDAAGVGFLDVTAGQPFFFECFFDPQACGGADGEDATAQDVADGLAESPANDTIAARLFLDEVFPTPGPIPTEGPVDQPTAGPVPAPQPSGEPTAAGAGTTGSTRATTSGPTYAQTGSEPTTSSVTLDRVVQGSFGFSVFVDNGQCAGCGPVFARPAGQDRIGTSVAVSSYAFGLADTVVLAPAGDYPSALVAGPLAAGLDAPVLLSNDDALAPEVAQAIRDLGATTAVIVAPDGQLGGTVDADLAAAGITTVDRIGGADRYDVAANVARRIGGTSAWLVEGENADPGRGWPDAMSAAPIAAQQGLPILLTRTGDLPGPISTVITELGVTDISIAGGTAAVGQPVVAALESASVSVARVAGETRYGTSALLARLAIDGGANPFNTWLVTGNNFPDGLSAAPGIARTGGVMLMVDGTELQNSPPSIEYLRELAFTGPVITLVGGFSAISQHVEEQVFGVLVGNEQPVPVGEASG